MRVELRAAEEPVRISAPEPKADKATLDAWMDDFEKEAHFVPFGRNMFLHDKYTDIMLELYPNYYYGQIHIAAIINVGERQQGHATKVIQWMMDLADKHGVELDGTISPIKNTRPRDGRRALNKAELTRWYKKVGFKVERHGDLIYKPGSRPNANPQG